jgi:hypothetical protein
MSTFALIQALLLASVLVYCLVVAVRKLAPETTRRALGRLSARLDAPGHARVMRRLGRWLQPAEARSGACGDGDGCGSCRGCAPAPEVTANPPIPLHVKPRKKD